MVYVLERGSLFGPSIPACKCLDTLATEVGRDLAVRNAAIAHDFPADRDRWMALLDRIGQPLAEGPHPGAHPDLPRRRRPCASTSSRPPTSAAQHGLLGSHSASSSTGDQGRFVALYIADPGWQDEPHASASCTAVRWVDALAWMQAHSPGTYAADFALLSGTPFPSEDGSPAGRPLLFPCTRATSPVDLGARVPRGALGRAQRAAYRDPRLKPYAAAVSRFLAAADHPEVRHALDLRAGDVVLLDNERIGHGRLALPALPGRSNPRDVWSMVLA